MKNSQYPSDLDGCVVTPEQVLDRLHALERKLAERFQIRCGHTREALVDMDRRGVLPYDDSIEEWRATLASYLDDRSTG